MIKRAIAAGAVAVASVAGTAALAAPPAQAWPWSGNVVLQGGSSCASSPTTWVWVSAPNGESGWATNGRGRYSKTFQRVPAGGMRVRINYGNATFRCHDDVFVRRANVGNSLTVNLVKIIPNG